MSGVAPVPVTLVTGFLGSGKTTLVNRLVNGVGHDHVLVIENELGDLDLDSELVDAGAVVSVPGGCACCSSAGAFVSALATAAQSQRSGRLRRVVVEASGAADAATMARQMLLAADELAPLALTGIVAVVDARRLEDDLRRHPVVVRQLGCADVVVLNKLDLVAPGSASRLRRLVRGVAPLADIVSARRCRVDLDRVLRSRVDVDAVERAARLAARAHDGRGAHALSAVALEAPGHVSLPLIQAWLDALLALRGRDLLRVKAVLALEGRHRRYVLHGVRDTFEGAWGAPWAGTTPSSRVVLIGVGLEALPLEQSLCDCVVA